MSDTPLTPDEQKAWARSYAMELFHFSGGGIPRQGTSYELRPIGKPEPPDPPRREPTSSGEKEQWVERPRRDYAQALADYTAIPFRVVVSMPGSGPGKLSLSGVEAKEFLLWIGGLVACPACAVTRLTAHTNNERCPACDGPLLRCYDALVWARTQVDLAAGNWTTLDELPDGTLFHLESGQRGMTLMEERLDDATRQIVWAGTGAVASLALDLRVRPISLPVPPDEETPP